MIGEVKKDTKLLREKGLEGLMIFLANKSVREHSEALMDPQPGHGCLCVMVVFVCPQKALEHLS